MHLGQDLGFLRRRQIFQVRQVGNFGIPENSGNFPRIPESGNSQECIYLYLPVKKPFGQMTFLGKIIFRSNGVRVKDDLVIWASNGVSFQRHSVKKFGEMIFRLIELEPWPELGFFFVNLILP
jgi:hypothetical protein